MKRKEPDAPHSSSKQCSKRLCASNCGETLEPGGPLATMPYEIVQHLLSYLPPEDKHACLLSNKALFFTPHHGVRKTARRFAAVRSVPELVRLYELLSGAIGDKPFVDFELLELENVCGDMLSHELLPSVLSRFQNVAVTTGSHFQNVAFITEPECSGTDRAYEEMKSRWGMAIAQCNNAPAVFLPYFATDTEKWLFTVNDVAKGNMAQPGHLTHEVKYNEGKIYKGATRRARWEEFLFKLSTRRYFYISLLELVIEVNKDGQLFAKLGPQSVDDLLSVLSLPHVRCYQILVVFALARDVVVALDRDVLDRDALLESLTTTADNFVRQIVETGCVQRGRDIAQTGGDLFRWGRSTTGIARFWKFHKQKQAAIGVMVSRFNAMPTNFTSFLQYAHTKLLASLQL